ncbi:MAG: pyridoxine 5'-phosphate synthase [Nitrospirae bacterium]|nr:pyridoxine 5'-phosphate synthase [Nitrospirota bacterium]
MTRLGVNIDHVATLRQARGGREPEPVAAAILVESAGADGIVVHLREDRRHIQDRDLKLLRQVVTTRLNLEMAPAEEIVNIAVKVKPELVTLVPERREELTTEGGLNVIKHKEMLKRVIARFHKNKINVSIFIDPDSKQIQAARDTGAGIIEIHTGHYANASSLQLEAEEKQAIVNAALFARGIGLDVSAGHGLNYRNVRAIAGINEIEELNIGHSLISRALLVGLEQAVREMKQLMI